LAKRQLAVRKAWTETQAVRPSLMAAEAKVAAKQKHKHAVRNRPASSGPG